MEAHKLLYPLWVERGPYWKGCDPISVLNLMTLNKSWSLSDRSVSLIPSSALPSKAFFVPSTWLNPTNDHTSWHLPWIWALTCVSVFLTKLRPKRLEVSHSWVVGYPVRPYKLCAEKTLTNPSWMEQMGLFFFPGKTTYLFWNFDYFFCKMCFYLFIFKLEYNCFTMLC